MHYSSTPPPIDVARQNKRSSLLHALGAAVRARRNECRLTLRALAEKAHVSERFLVQLETGEGNISVARLQDVAEAMGTSAAQLLLACEQEEAPARDVVALIGLRGAGKTTIGQVVAKKLGVPFVELDAMVARAAGMPLSMVFEMHGEAYFRRLELDTLKKLIDSSDGAVVATGGSIVTSAEAFDLLRRRTTTVWLKARARDHWNRVVEQGDLRPMKNRANAMTELRGLLRARRSLYAQADHVIDTSTLSVEEATKRIVTATRTRKKP
jgi:XRE family aerobic/anaerobic benzoate catabolism transcriptional regulator